MGMETRVQLEGKRNCRQTAPCRTGNAERRAMLRGLAGEIDADFRWLGAPVLNGTTRLAMVADARAGWVVARGYEAGAAATQDLRLDCR